MDSWKGRERLDYRNVGSLVTFEGTRDQTGVVVARRLPEQLRKRLNIQLQWMR